MFSISREAVYREAEDYRHCQGLGCSFEITVCDPAEGQKGVKEVYLKAVNQLISNKEPALEMMRSIKERLDDTSELEMNLQKADKEFEDTLVLFQDYISKNAITEADLTEGRYAELEARYTDSKARVDDLRAELTTVRRRGASIGRFIERVGAFEDTFLEFSEELWTGLAGTITVIDKNHYKVRFKSGFETNVEI